MSFLDLYQGDQDQAARIQPTEGTRMPSGFSENFHAAWSDGLLFSQSTARDNARGAALSDYLSEIKQKTGRDLAQEDVPTIAGGQTGVTDFSQANERVAKMKADYPDLDLAPLSDDEIDKRALAKATASHRSYETLEAGEKTWGGSFGSFLGGAAAGGADPINIVGMAVAPEVGGATILSAALRWGGLAAVSQAAISFQGDQFREKVQPGYIESGEPIKEIGGAFVGGAVLGGGTKALGNAWTRVKTGQWPTSVRDAGNVIESEANVVSTNPFPGTSSPPPDYVRLYRGEHPERNEVGGGYYTTDKEMASNFGKVNYVDLPTEDAKFFKMPGMGEIYHLTDYPSGPSKINWREHAAPEFDPVVGEVAHREALTKTIDDILAGRPVDVSAQITPELTQAATEPERPKAETIWYQGVHSKAGGKPISDYWTTDLEKAKEYSGPGGHVFAALESSFPDEALGTKTGNVLSNKKITPGEPYSIPEVETLGKLPRSAAAEDFAALSKGPPKQLDLPLAPETEPVAPKRVSEEGTQPVLHTAEDMTKTMTAPAHQDAIRADIDRERAMGDFKVPGVDENGNHVMHSVDAAMDEVDAYKKLADDIQACAAPAQEGAE